MRKVARLVAPATLAAGVSACASLSGLTAFGPGDEAGVAGEGPEVAIKGDASTSDGGGDDSGFQDALTCQDGLVDCGGVCVVASSPLCSPDAATGSDGAGIADDASAEGGGDSGGGDGPPCTPLSLPPAINVDPATWAASFKTSPAWSCTASGTTTIDSSAGSITSTSCALGMPDFTNGVAQSGSGGPAAMVVRLRGLTVSGGHVIHVQGSKPVVFLVSGDVLVDSGGRSTQGRAAARQGPEGASPRTARAPRARRRRRSAQEGAAGASGRLAATGRPATGPAGRRGAPPAARCSRCEEAVRAVPAGAAAAAPLARAAEPSRSPRRAPSPSAPAANTAVLTAAGGYSTGATGVNAGSAGAGSGGGILLVSAGGTTVGSSAALRAHGGGSGSGRGVNANGQSGANGHSADDTPASGGAAPDVNGAAGVAGGLCKGSGCATSASGGNGVMSFAAGLDGSGGGGGGGRIQVITGAATSVCE